MSEELTPEQKFARDDPDTLVPGELARGRSRDEIIAELVRLDWSPDAARAAVTRIANEFDRYTVSPESRAQLVAEKEKMRKIGAGLLATGLITTLVGYLTDSTLQLYLGGALAWLGFVGTLVPGRELRRYRKYADLANRHKRERNA